MIAIEKTEIIGLNHAVRGMRNALESWDKSDSFWQCVDYDSLNENDIYKYELGPNDLGLMKRLRNAGTDHRKFMRMIVVYVDILAPLYWWKEFDTYKVGTVVNSCSTMHCIHKKEFTLEDFSCEHLDDEETAAISHPDEVYRHEYTSKYILSLTVTALNYNREQYLETKDKQYWWQMIQLLPTSYNQRRTVMLNYEVLANIYKSRKDHKLDDWREFCDWIRELPYSELITGED